MTPDQQNYEINQFLKHKSSFFRAKDGSLEEKPRLLELILHGSDTVVGSIQIDSAKYLQNKEVNVETFQLENL